jgi:hypothetical protein
VDDGFFPEAVRADGGDFGDYDSGLYVGGRGLSLLQRFPQIFRREIAVAEDLVQQDPARASHPSATARLYFGHLRDEESDGCLGRERPGNLFSPSQRSIQRR